MNEEKQKGFCPFQYRICLEEIEGKQGTMIKNKQCNEQCALYTPVGCIFKSIGINLGNIARGKQ